MYNYSFHNRQRKHNRNEWWKDTVDKRLNCVFYRQKRKVSPWNFSLRTNAPLEIAVLKLGVSARKKHQSWYKIGAFFNEINPSDLLNTWPAWNIAPQCKIRLRRVNLFHFTENKVFYFTISAGNYFKSTKLIFH